MMTESRWQGVSAKLHSWQLQVLVLESVQPHTQLHPGGLLPAGMGRRDPRVEGLVMELRLSKVRHQGHTVWQNTKHRPKARPCIQTPRPAFSVPLADSGEFEMRGICLKQSSAELTAMFSSHQGKPVSLRSLEMVAPACLRT